MTAYAHPGVLVETDWVHEHLHDPSIRLVEIDVDGQAYDAGHIPGAVGLNWQSQLQDVVRRDILSEEQFARLVGEAGIWSASISALPSRMPIAATIFPAGRTRLQTLPRSGR